MKETVYYPFNLPGNAYVDITKNIIKQSGYNVIDIKQIKKNPLRLRNIKVINFNWFDILHADSYFSGSVKLLVKKLLIYIIKMSGTAIIFTMHNKQGHDSKCPKLDKNLLKFMCMHSDAIVILSNETRVVISKRLNNEKLFEKINEKIHLVPIPNYIGYYPYCDKNYRKEWGILPGEMVCLFVGAIREYKNIEIIMQAAKKCEGQNIRFIVTGNGNKEYIEKLIKISDKNVIFIPQFIPDDELTAMLRASDVLVLPYDLASSLNSSTCILAFSHKKNVVCPQIGTIKELHNQLCYTYTYETKLEHEKNFLNQIQIAYQEFTQKPTTFIARGEALYEEIQTVNSHLKLTQIYKDIYDSIAFS